MYLIGVYPMNNSYVFAHLRMNDTDPQEILHMALMVTCESICSVFGVFAHLRPLAQPKHLKE